MSTNYSKYKDNELYTLLRGRKEDAEGAFTEIYARYSQRVFAYCLRIIGNEDDAKDVFQNVFIKFYDSVHHRERMDFVGAFLLRIARNSCISFQRKNVTHLKLEDSFAKSDDFGYDQQELLQLISNAIELLDFEFREVFVLRQYHNLPYSEISKIVGDSETAVKSRYWRAKEKLKEILSPYLADLSK